MTLSRLWCRYNGVIGVAVGLGIVVWAALAGDPGPAGLGVLAMGLGVARLWAARCALRYDDRDDEAVTDRSRRGSDARPPRDRRPV